MTSRQRVKRAVAFKHRIASDLPCRFAGGELKYGPTLDEILTQFRETSAGTTSPTWSPKISPPCTRKGGMQMTLAPSGFEGWGYVVSRGMAPR